MNPSPPTVAAAIAQPRVPRSRGGPAVVAIGSSRSSRRASASWAVARAGGRLASALIDLALPPRCVLCQDAGAVLCATCRRDAMGPLDTGCRCCALPLPRGRPARLCGRCLRSPPAYQRTFAAAAYAAPFDRLVLGLKYGAMLSYAPLLAALVDRRVRDGPPPGGERTDGVVDDAGRDEPRGNARPVDRSMRDAETAGDLAVAAIDAIVAVPLSRERMAARGFNQSIEIARHLARRWGKRLDTTSLLRIHDTVPQAGLTLDARRGNVRRAFAVTDEGRARLAGCTVAVVDDVMTTGATLDEVARTLRRAGAAVVVNAVVARRP